VFSLPVTCTALALLFSFPFLSLLGYTSLCLPRPSRLTPSTSELPTVQQGLMWFQMKTTAFMETFASFYEEMRKLLIFATLSSCKKQAA
jgi:hypothetical protein